MGGVVSDRGKIMTDHQLGKAPFAPKVIQQFAEVMFTLKIHPGCRLIQDQQVRFLSERKRQEHTLHFSARQSSDPSFFQSTYLDAGQEFPGPITIAPMDAEPQGASLPTHDHELQYGERHAPVELKPLRDISDAQVSRLIRAGNADTAREGHFSQKGQ